eukprot:14857819-Alexandrium_andersonii.AAC.1
MGGLLGLQAPLDLPTLAHVQEADLGHGRNGRQPQLEVGRAPRCWLQPQCADPARRLVHRAPGAVLGDAPPLA